MAQDLHRKYGFPTLRAEDLPQEEQYDWEPNDPLLEGVVTLADLYDRYAAKPFRENVMTDASPVVQKFKEVQGRIGGQDLPTDMLLGMVDPQDPLTYLPGVGPALRAGMRTAKEAALAAKNVANVARAAKGADIAYPEAKSLADLGAAFSTVSPKKFDINVQSALRRYLQGKASEKDLAFLMRLQKTGYVIDPLNPTNILDVASIPSGSIPMSLLKDIDNNFGGFGNAHRRKELALGDEESSLLKGFIENPEDFTAAHFQTTFRGGTPGAHLTGSDAALLAQERAATSANLPYQMSHWGPGVYYYPSESVAANNLRRSAKEFTKTISADDAGMYMAPQLGIDAQAPGVRDVLISNDILDLSATQDSPVWESLQQLQAAAPELEYLETMRKMGLKGSQQIDRGIEMDALKKRHEFLDYDFLKAPWREK